MSAQGSERSRWLLRHGETTGGSGFRGRTDDPLTSTGRDAMFDAVARLDPPSLVVTSPLVRCRAFAETFASRHRVPLTADPALAEMDFGDWEGMTAEEVLRRDPATLSDFWRDPRSVSPPGGESFTDFEKRVADAWQRIVARREPRVLVVAHAGVIRVILCLAQPDRFASLFDAQVPYASLHRVA